MQIHHPQTPSPSRQMLEQITTSHYGLTGALVGGALGLLIERSLKR